MKKIKKIFALCLILVLAMGIFTGCGSSTDLSSSPYCGDWIVVSDQKKISLSLKKNGEAIPIMWKNGEGILLNGMVDSEAEGKCKWEEIGNGILMTDPSGDEEALIWEDGYLTWTHTYEGEMQTIYFEKY